MGTETERRFLVLRDRWEPTGTSYGVEQAYLSLDPDRVVRARATRDPSGGETGLLTVKGRRVGASCPEFNSAIPAGDARGMFALRLGRILAKTRHVVTYGGREWDVDFFHAEHEGLAIAEIELDDADDAFERPPWIGAEVTHDPSLSNLALATGPLRGDPAPAVAVIVRLAEDLYGALADLGHALDGEVLPGGNAAAVARADDCLARLSDFAERHARDTAPRNDPSRDLVALVRRYAGAIRNGRDVSDVRDWLHREVAEFDAEVDGADGADGIAGEGIDVALCALDAVVLARPDMTDDQIVDLAVRKLDKWYVKYRDSVAGDQDSDWETEVEALSANRPF